MKMVSHCTPSWINCSYILNTLSSVSLAPFSWHFSVSTYYGRLRRVTSNSEWESHFYLQSTLWSKYVVTLYRINETWMNTFLFNVALILIASVSVTQFCTKAFSEYTRNSDLTLMFVQIQYLGFFNYFFNNLIFEYALLVHNYVIAILGMVCISCNLLNHKTLWQTQTGRHARSQESRKKWNWTQSVSYMEINII